MAVEQGDDDLLLWIWYLCMLIVVVLNIILFAIFFVKVKTTDAYGLAMKILAFPWVFECCWRSIFPSLYLQRYVLWDTMLNSILVDRTLAFIGELSWVSQTALALRHVDREISSSTNGTRWVQITAWAAVLVYVVAEGVSYYNVATLNEFWCAMEVLLDGLSYICMLPGAIYCFILARKTGAARSARVFLGVLSLVCVFYPAYNILVDAPMYMARYRADQRNNHTHYLPFIEGLEDALVRRVVAHKLADWKQDMFWMTTYFSFGAWSGILLMNAPRAKPQQHGTKHVQLLDL